MLFSLTKLELVLSVSTLLGVIFIVIVSYGVEDNSNIIVNEKSASKLASTDNLIDEDGGVEAEETGLFVGLFAAAKVNNNKRTYFCSALLFQ